MTLSREAYEKLDKGDIDAAIELGDSVCRELGICCTEKGKVMFQVFKKLQELKAKEAAELAAKRDEAAARGDEAAAREAAAELAQVEGFPSAAEMLKEGGEERA